MSADSLSKEEVEKLVLTTGKLLNIVVLQSQGIARLVDLAQSLLVELEKTRSHSAKSPPDV